MGVGPHEEEAEEDEEETKEDVQEVKEEPLPPSSELPQQLQLFFELRGPAGQREAKRVAIVGGGPRNGAKGPTTAGPRPGRHSYGRSSGSGGDTSGWRAAGGRAALRGDPKAGRAVEEATGRPATTPAATTPAAPATTTPLGAGATTTPVAHGTTTAWETVTPLLAAAARLRHGMPGAKASPVEPGIGDGNVKLEPPKAVVTMMSMSRWR